MLRISKQKMKELLKLCTSLLNKNKSVLLTVIRLIVIEDIIFFQTQSDLVYFWILGLYMLATGFYKLTSKETFFFCFFIVALLFIEFVFTGTSEHTEKAAVWLFLFMAIGIFQELLLDKR